MIYLLDANVYIEAKNRYYRMTVCPGFWDWMDLQFASGQVSSIRMVFDELSKNDDALSEWVKSGNTILQKRMTRTRQQEYTEIWGKGGEIDYVQKVMLNEAFVEVDLIFLGSLIFWVSML